MLGLISRSSTLFSYLSGSPLAFQAVPALAIDLHQCLRHQSFTLDSFFFLPYVLLWVLGHLMPFHGFVPAQLSKSFYLSFPSLSSRMSTSEEIQSVYVSVLGVRSPHCLPGLFVTVWYMYLTNCYLQSHVPE